MANLPSNQKHCESTPKYGIEKVFGGSAWIHDKEISDKQVLSTSIVYQGVLVWSKEGFECIL